MTATRAEARANARAMVGDYGWYRLCLKFVRTCFEISPKYLTAGLAWQGAQFKHHFGGDYGDVPRGVPFWWDTTGTSEHVALTLGRDKEGYRLCASNDVFSPGRIDGVRMSTLAAKWNARPLGWAEDLNGVRIWTPKPKKTPNWDKIVEYGRLARDAAKDPSVRDDAVQVILTALKHSTTY